MKWYIERLEALERAEPIYSVCGDDCAVCPRYVARTEEELHATAVFWHRAGWRDRVVSNEEIRCTGCGSRATCSFMLLPCAREHGVDACRECPGLSVGRCGTPSRAPRRRSASASRPATRRRNSGCSAGPSTKRKRTCAERTDESGGQTDETGA